MRRLIYDREKVQSYKIFLSTNARKDRVERNITSKLSTLIAFDSKKPNIESYFISSARRCKILLVKKNFVTKTHLVARANMSTGTSHCMVPDIKRTIKGTS